MIKVWGAILHGLKFCSTGFGVNSMQCRVWGWGSMAQQLHTITACVQGWQFQSICMPTLQWLGWHCERFWGVLYWVWGSILHDLNFYSARVGNAVFLYRAWDSVLWSKGFRSHTGFSLHSTWFGVPFWRIWRSNLHGEGVHSTGHGVYSKGSGVSFCRTWGSILQGFEIHRPSDHSKVWRH